MLAIHPYLNFDGKTEEAFNFYRSVFGGEFTSFQRMKDMPNNTMPASEQERVMHVALPIGKGNILMGSDILPSQGDSLRAGNNFYVLIAPESEGEANKIFNALSAGGKIAAPLGKTFWGAYFGMFTDKYGIQWMINYEYERR